ncbi:MAG: type II toxin-antitoxin system VapC family toxin [Candidatus Altiarchaeota archaeon]|nr:type II toxin-antitoxin system VapC family toxin [Candidatus Altiarchaeota archaeon]
MITFDTYAWVEYFQGSEKGEEAKQYIDSDGIIFTPTICLSEFKAKLLKEGISKSDQEKAINVILARSLLMPLDSDIALKAAEFKNEGLYLVDAVVYATAMRNKTQLLTGDKHFEGYDNVRFLG